MEFDVDPRVPMLCLAQSMEANVSLPDFGRIERETAHLIPRYPQYNEAGALGAAYGFVGIIIFWLTNAAGLYWLFAGCLAVAVAYAAGRYDGGRAWKPYHREYSRLLEEEIRDAQGS
jgi:hypothetical protein